jgi:acetyl esterase/lipase
MDIAPSVEPELLPAFLALPSIDSPAADPAAAREMTRALVEELRGTNTGDPSVVREDALVASRESERHIRIRLYRPSENSAELPVLVFVHGGGFVVGDLDTADDQCERLARVGQLLVASVDYRLAPEHPFPAAVFDCYDVLLWLADSARALNIDRARIAIMGESAGGAISAGTALLARDEGHVSLAHQSLIWACLDDRHETTSCLELSDRRVWNREVSISCWRAYLGSAGAHVSQYAAPARAEALAGLPPTYISVGQLDIVRDENVEYARRLMASGVRTELHVYPGGFHGFEVFAPEARISCAARADRDNALNRALNQERAGIAA